MGRWGSGVQECDATADGIAELVAMLVGTVGTTLGLNQWPIVERDAFPALLALRGLARVGCVLSLQRDAVEHWRAQLHQELDAYSVGLWGEAEHRHDLHQHINLMLDDILAATTDGSNGRRLALQRTEGRSRHLRLVK